MAATQTKTNAPLTEREEEKRREILKKIHAIEINTRRLVNAGFSGQYHSVFKGRGMEFSEVRQYAAGDDVRAIDWNVTARAGETYIKVFHEERELTLMLLVDMSGSGAFGTVAQTKREVAAEISALLAFSAIKNNDRVGLMIFTDRVEEFIPPKKGRKHVLRVIRDLLFFEPRGNKTDMNAALEHFTQIMKRRSVAFVISDFLDLDYEKTMRIASRRHDMIAVPLTDPRERTFPNVGIIRLRDAETGEELLVDTASARVRSQFAKKMRGHYLKRDQFFNRVNLDRIEIQTDQSYAAPLSRFFRERANKFR